LKATAVFNYHLFVMEASTGFALVGAYVHVYNIVTQLWTDWAVFWGGGEMADAADLKSAGVNLRVGSNPTRPTHFRPFGAFFVYAK
jgi:hypothetical protein